MLVEPGDFKTNITDNRIYVKAAKENSLHHENFTRAITIMEREERNGPDPIKLAILINKIINLKNPKLRYRIGPALEIAAVHLKKILPSRLFEFLLMKNYGIS